MGTQESHSADASPSMQVMQLLWPGALAVQTVHVAAKLGLADLVADGPKTVLQLAEATGTHGPSLGRLLRALTSLGLFTEEGPSGYRQTALSDTLRADHPESMRRWALMLGAHFAWEPCGKLSEAIQTGQPAFESIYGAPFFHYLADHASDAAVFNAAMSSLPAYVAAIVEAYDYSKFERIIDVGGGHGAKLAAILSANPRLYGVLYDLPEVVASATVLHNGDLAHRCEIVAGDFFEGVPAGADAYFLSGIIHDWNDEAASRILKNCRRAIPPDGRLLLIETVLTPTSNPERALMDVLMMVLTGGRERAEGELRALLQEGGFTIMQVIPTLGASLIECRPT